MTTGRVLLLVLVLLSGLRVGLVLFEDPSPAETYYHLCAAHPAPAYFDGPAGMAGLIRAAESLGLPEGWWRLQAPLWVLLATWALYLLARRLGSAENAAWAGLAFNAIPLVNVAALRVGPMMPALIATCLALLFVWRAFEARRQRLLWCLAAGLALGVAGSFAYLTVAWIPGLVLFVLCSRKHRQGEYFLGLGIVVLVPGLMLAPAMAWNAALEWIPVAGGTLQTLWMFDFWGFFISAGDLLWAYSPLLLPLVIWAWVEAMKQSRFQIRARFLFLGALPGVALAGYFALRGQEAVWDLVPALPLLLIAFLDLDFSGAWRRTLSGLAFVLAIALSASAMLGVAQSGEGWRGVAAELRTTFFDRSDAIGEGLFLVAADPALASVLAYHLEDDLVPPLGHPLIYVRESQDVSNQFGLWPSYGDFVVTAREEEGEYSEQEGENPFLGRSALYITPESPEELPQTIEGAFGQVTFLRKLSPANPDTEALYIYECLDYQTQPL